MTEVINKTQLLNFNKNNNYIKKSYDYTDKKTYVKKENNNIDKYNNKIMLIGKYKGDKIIDIFKKDKPYLLYMWNLEDLNAGLKYIINFVLKNN